MQVEVTRKKCGATRGFGFGEEGRVTRRIVKEQMKNETKRSV